LDNERGEAVREAEEANPFGKLPVFLTCATKPNGEGVAKWAVLSLLPV